MSMLGLLLVVVGAVLMIAEAHFPSHGVLATGAATALTAGAVLALAGAGAAGTTVVATGITVALVGFAAAWLLVAKSLAAHRLVVRSGPQALTGRVATVRRVPAPIGQVQLDGALWRARMWDLDEDGVLVAEGSAVVVESIEGLTLTVRSAEEWEVH
jgi:membrane-bound serine protease (ClpP class)